MLRWDGDEIGAPGDSLKLIGRRGIAGNTRRAGIKKKSGATPAERDPIFLGCPFTARLRKPSDPYKIAIFGESLEIVQSRRLINTMIRLPDGRRLTPSATILSYSVHTTFVRHSNEADRNALIKHTNDFMQGLAVGAHMDDKVSGSSGDLLNSGLLSPGNHDRSSILSTVTLIRNATALARLGARNARR